MVALLLTYISEKRIVGYFDVSIDTNFERNFEKYDLINVNENDLQPRKYGFKSWMIDISLNIFCGKK